MPLGLVAEAYNRTYSGRQADKHRIIINSKATWASEHISVQGQPRQLSETLSPRDTGQQQISIPILYTFFLKVSNKNL